MAQPHFPTLVFLKSLLSYRGDASAVSASVVFGRVTVKTKAVQQDMWTRNKLQYNQHFLSSPESERFVQKRVCGVKLHGHAQATVQHVAVAVLGTECLVGDLEAGRAVHGSVDPRHLTSPNKRHRASGHLNPSPSKLQLVVFSPLCERGPVGC